LYHKIPENAHSPVLPVTGASAVAAVDAVESKNREQNGQGVQNANRGVPADTLVGTFLDTPDLISDLHADQIYAAKDVQMAHQAVAAGLCPPSVRGLRRHFHWGQARATRALRGVKAISGQS